MDFKWGKSMKGEKQPGALLNSDKTDETTAKILESSPDGFPGQMFVCKFRLTVSELDMRFKVQNDWVI